MNNEEKILDVLASLSLRMGSMEGKMDSIDSRLTKLEFKIETDIETRLDALAEGHAAILEQLIPRTRVDELEGRVKVLESLIYRMNDELVQLKRAQ